MTPVTSVSGYTTTRNPSASGVAIWQLTRPDPRSGHAVIAMAGVSSENVTSYPRALVRMQRIESTEIIDEQG
jgi:hypothetical protein